MSPATIAVFIIEARCCTFLDSELTSYVDLNRGR